MVAFAEIDTPETPSGPLSFGSAVAVAVEDDGVVADRHLLVARVCAEKQGGATFTGYVADNETGLFYARARMYSPGLGRFVSRDEAGYVDGYLCYGAYFIPNYVDPTGMGLWSAIAKLLGKELTEDAAKAVAKDLAKGLLEKIKTLKPGDPGAQDVIEKLKQLGWEESPLGKGSQAGKTLEEGGGIKLQNRETGEMLSWTPGSAHHPGAGSYWKFSTGPSGTIRTIGSFIAPGLTGALNNDGTSTSEYIVVVVGDVADLVAIGPDTVSTVSTLLDSATNSAANALANTTFCDQARQWFYQNFGYYP